MFWTVLVALLVASPGVLQALHLVSNYPAKFKGTCPAVHLEANVAIKDFTGLWYEIGYYNRGLPYNGDCVKHNITTSSNNKYGFNVDIIKNAELVGKIDLKPKENGKSGFDAALTYPLTSTNAGAFEYYILATDYDCMAVLYTCRNDGNLHISSAYVLTRDPYGQCYIMRRLGGIGHEEVRNIPDLEFEYYESNELVGCRVRDWKYNED